MLVHTTDPRLIFLDIPGIRVNSLLNCAYTYEPSIKYGSHSILPFSTERITIPQVYLNQISLNNWICFYHKCSPYHFYPVQDWMISMAIDMVKEKIKAMQRTCEERGETLFPDYYVI